MQRLNDVSIRSLPVPALGQRTYFDTTLPSFGCRVSQGGTRSFVVMHGRERTLKTIGRYPIITLAEARAEAKRILAKRTLEKFRPQTIPWTEAIALYLAHCGRKNRPRTVDWYSYLLGYFDFHRRALSDISPQELQRIIDRLANRPGLQAAALVATRAFFNWAERRHYVDRSPCARMERPKRQKSRTRTLTDDELKKVWQATGSCATFGVIVRLLILTGQRRSEIAALQREWLCGNALQLPASICKNGQEHSIPTGRLFRSVISSHGIPTTGLIFPARRTENSKPFSGWSKAKSALDKKSQIEPWTLHDLRRTFATRLADMGVAPHVIERLLNHSSGTISGVAATYNRALYLPEMKAAMELWERHVERLIRRERRAA